MRPEADVNRPGKIHSRQPGLEPGAHRNNSGPRPLSPGEAGEHPSSAPSTIMETHRSRRSEALCCQMHALRPIDLEQDERSSGTWTRLQTKTQDNNNVIIMRKQGRFWAPVRRLIWEKAQELFQIDQVKTMNEDFKGITAEHKELKEAGYFYTAKLMVLRNLWREKKGLPPLEEEEYGHL